MLQRLFKVIWPFGKKEVIPTLEEVQQEIRKKAAARLTILRISRFMRARDERKRADEKRKKRALKRMANPPAPKHMGEVDDEAYGAKPAFYSHGVLFKDGSGEHVLEVL